MSNIKEIVQKQRDFFESGKTQSIDFRLRQLEILKKAIQKNEKVIAAALKKDLNKSAFEAYETEIGFVLAEITHIQKNLRKWAKSRLLPSELIAFPSISYVQTSPRGVVLIMSPWNYPFQLTIAPLVGAIAAGNCAVLKPSNYAPVTADVIAQLTRKYFKEDYITTIIGGREANQDLLNESFDFIFFTGGETVGKLVMKSASQHLTPVVLELGGKSPCIVDETANLKMAAKRIAWGKYINAGQTCVAPDYLLIQRSVKKQFLQYLTAYLKKYYGDQAETNENFPRIINKKHFTRLYDLMHSCGKVIYGGGINEDTLQIAPTLIDNVTVQCPIMAEEVFGPLFPIVTFDNICEVKPIVQANKNPLALYLFTTSKQNEDEILNNIRFGGGCINEVIMHMTSPHMPFGGVGTSGMGKYHGIHSYKTFSHPKSIMKKFNIYEPLIRYAPHSKWKEKLLRLMMK